MLPTPTFHHVHLNSTDPDAAIGFYTHAFASTAKTTWNGIAALRTRILDAAVEVEEVLLRHAGVKEVSVIGRPDREWGEVVVAYVVGDAPAGELDALCLNAIARFKRPKDYVFVDALPKNNYGKILKTELRAADTKQSAERNATRAKG